MAAPETFDPKRYTPFEVGVPAEKILCTFPAIDTAVDNIKISQGLENVAKVHGPGDADPLARRRRPGQHPALAAPVSLAHRLRAAADGRRSAPRLVDRPRPRAEQPGHPGVHQHRPAARRRRRVGGAEGVHHRRLLRQRVRPVQPALPDRCRRRRPPAEGHDRRALRGPAEDATRNCSSAARSANWPATIIRSRCCGPSTTPTACSARRSATPST